MSKIDTIFYHNTNGLNLIASEDYRKQSGEIVSALLMQSPRVWPLLDTMIADHPEWAEVKHYLQANTAIEKPEEEEEEPLPF